LLVVVVVAQEMDIAAVAAERVDLERQQD